MRRPLKRTNSLTMPDDLASKKTRENTEKEIAAIPKSINFFIFISIN